MQVYPAYWDVFYYLQGQLSVSSLHKVCTKIIREVYVYLVLLPFKVPAKYYFFLIREFSKTIIDTKKEYSSKVSQVDGKRVNFL